MAGQDIDLLFGVQGDGSLSGESGSRIKRQLTAIITELNKNPLKVAVEIDTSSTANKSWANQIQQKLDQISASNGLSIQVSTVKLIPGAVDGFKRQLASIVNNLSSSNGAEITISSKGLGELKGGLKETRSELEKAQAVTERIGASAKSAGTEAVNAAKAVSELGRSTQNVGKDGAATNWEDLIKRIASTATQAQSLLRENTEASKASVNSESVSYQKLTEQLGILDGILKECKGDANNLEAALKNVNIQDVLSKTSAAIATLKNELGNAGLSGSTSLRELTDTVARMQSLLTKNPQMSGSEAFDAMSKQVAELNSVINACGGDAERLESALRKAGLNSASVIEDAKSAMSSFKAEIEDTRAIAGSVSAFQRASHAIKEYYALLSKASRIKNQDVVLTNDGYQSKSGDYAKLADELNKAEAAFASYTSQAAKSKMSETERLKLAQLLEDQERRLTLAIEERTAKQSESTTATAEEAAAVKVQMESLLDQKNAIRQAIQSFGKGNSTDAEKAKIAEITAEYEQWALKIEEIRALKSAIPAGQKEAIEAEGAAIRSNIDLLSEERKAREASSKSGNSEAEKEAAYQNKKNAALKEGVILLGQMKKAERDWTAARNGKSKVSYSSIIADIGKLEAAYNSLRTSADKSEDEIKKFQSTLSDIRTSFAQNSTAIKNASENTKTFSARLSGLAQKFSAWFGVTRVIMYGVRAVRQMVSATIELDDAMTQLEIVTRGTSQAYEEYLEKISQTATKIGSAIPDLIDSTTTFARLGYSLEESSSLAEFTAMLQNVGNIDVSDAQNAITAIIKAFGVSVDEIESVMDKLVITGNNFPISVSQIAEGMNNASSALAAAGNTFDQSVALLTAANTTIQNAAKSSTGLRTIAARLRSTKTELDELGEAMTEAEYEELVAALTKYNVALTDANEEFRSTYDIVADIAKIWDKLPSMEQAALANAIAGVRQQSVFYSLVEQFREASGAMDDMANSAGTLQESYSAFLESVTAHINKFKAAFQSVGMSIFTTDFLKGIIDLGTNILKIFDAIVKVSNVIGGLNTTLYVTVGLIATLQADILWAKVLKLITPIKSIISILQVARANSVTAGQFISNAFNQIAVSASAAQIAIGGFFAVFGIISILKNSIENAAEKTRQKFEELHSTLNETKEELNNLNSELETSKSRLEELQGLSDSGTITIVEQEELNNLREEIVLLERRKAILEEHKKSEGEASDAALVKAFEKQAFDSPMEDYFAAEMAALLDERNKLVSDAETGWSDGALKRFDEIEARIRELNSLVYGENFAPDIKVGFEEYIDRLVKTYQMLSKISPEDMTDSSLSLFEDVRKKLVDAASVLQTDWIDNLEVDEKTRSSWQSLFDEIDRCVNPLGRFSSLLESLPDSVTDSLSKFAEDGELTAERVEELAKRFPALKSAMNDCGVSADDVAAHFNGLSLSAGHTADSIEELSTVLDTVGDLETIGKNIGAVSSALGEFSEEGNVSIGTLAGLSDELKNLSSFEDFVNILSDSASSMEDVQEACNKLAEEYISSTGIL